MEQDLNAPRECIDCGNEFVIGKGLQQRIQENPDYVAPKRCYDCGRAKKRAREDNDSGMQTPHN